MNVDAIFDAFYKAFDFVRLTDAARKKSVQIRDVTSRTCGNCDHWMKSTCVPEKKHGQLKSMGSIGCGAFSQAPAMAELASKFTSELDVINTRLAAMRRNSGTP